MKTSERMVKTIEELNEIINRLKEISNDQNLRNVFHNTGARYEIVHGGNELVKARNEIENGLKDQLVEEMNS